MTPEGSSASGDRVCAIAFDYTVDGFADVRKLFLLSTEGFRTRSGKNVGGVTLITAGRSDVRVASCLATAEAVGGSAASP